MSRSKKDGPGGGAHKSGHPGKEYWSARCHKCPMGTPGRFVKRVTHREERRASKRLAVWEPR